MRHLLLLSLLVFFLQYNTHTFGQKADFIFTNGKIFTSDTTQLYVQAVAIKGNKILAVGSTTSIEKLAGAKTKKINLQGKTMVPGFNDAHDHPGWGASIGKTYTYTELNPAGLSKTAVLDSIARLVKLTKPNEWISGFIGTDVFFDSSMRKALDSLAPNNPVGLQIWWGHGMVVNGKALEASGLHDTDKDPIGGWYIRDAGNKISALQQNAQAPVWMALNKSEPANLIKGLRSFAQEQLAAGITTVQFMGTGFDAAQAGKVFREASIPQRIRIIAWPRSTPRGRQLGDWKSKNTYPGPMVYLSGIKYVIDGTPMEQNALRTVPYEGKPDWYGKLNYSIDTMKQIFREALTSNRQLMMHITADSSFALVLSLMKEMASEEVWRSKRVRIEHNCVGDLSGNISDFNRKRLKDMGILMMHTPKYCMASPLQSLMEKGITLGISPDGTTNPFIEIMLITSTHPNPKENLTREQAVIAYTRTNALAEFTEKEKGMLTKGMLADLTVLSQDIFTIPNEQLPATQSVLTMVDGKIVYQQPEVLKPEK